MSPPTSKGSTPNRPVRLLRAHERWPAGADLDGADLCGAILKNTDWGEAPTPSRTVSVGGVHSLCGASLEGADRPGSSCAART
jgi:Pentapeptide repeats (8 copies)